MKVDFDAQSVILPGESVEADRRFDMALRVNGLCESQFVLDPPPEYQAQSTVLSGLQSAFHFDRQGPDTDYLPAAAKSELRGWEALYRRVTLSESAPRKGDLLDVLA